MDHRLRIRGEKRTPYTQHSVLSSLNLTQLTCPALVHQFFVPVNERVVKPRNRPAELEREKLAAQEQGQDDSTPEIQRYRVFGMTARMIVDCARVAYGREPEFEHNSHFGDEMMIAQLRRMGRLSARRQPSDELTRETMEKAAKLS